MSTFNYKLQGQKTVYCKKLSHSFKFFKINFRVLALRQKTPNYFEAKVLRSRSILCS